ncbi:hypothetical protein L9W92_18305 [Pelotomaculum terephthalicicum JT]|uniref:hypothetical protein n=1 Tax=Pelotomaculum terephthalicicum TaxID=206393 RepID=UPI001F049C1C|nr:hypothetical protein [Pelotomaculum terephthalicicum]MCG9969951.1 hypothetical protein [Pelotomaculum terephthalicicum JT]
MNNTVSLQEVTPDIGEKAAQVLKDKRAGYRIYITKKPTDFPDQASKEQYIKNAYYSGQTLDEIADDVGLSPEYVGKIVRKK